LKTGRPKINPDAFYKRGSRFQFAPSAGGAHNWAPMAFNPTTNLMYIPITASGAMSYRLPDSFTYNPAGQNMGVDFGFGGGGGAAGRGGPAAGRVAHPPEALPTRALHRRRTDHSTTTTRSSRGAAPAVGAGPVLP